jgi:penicillin amidase
MRRLVVPVVAVALLVPALVPLAAAADDSGFRAAVINTPGQSGHVPVADFLLRTAGEEVEFGPHMTDQLPLYSSFTYRDGRFRPDSGTPAMELLGARIYRDDLGVPTIYAADPVSAWRAVGYALSEDRMWQEHLLRMVAWGRLSELLGREGIEMDIAQRRDFYTEDEYQAIYDSLETWEQDNLDAYAEGVNLFIAEMHADPRKMPAEIAALSEPIEPWTALDSLALGALMARSVASDGGQELDNARLLEELIADHGNEEAQEIFNDLLWLNDPGAPTSVPAEEGEFSSYPDGGPLTESFSQSTEIVLDLLPDGYPKVARQLRAERELKQRLERELGLPNPGSDVWAVSPDRSANGSAFLFNGPQVGYTVPGLLVEFEVHITEGEQAMDAHGITVAGVPLVGIGYTDRHAWGLTSGLSDTKDLYVEKLVDDDRHYEFDGETLEMDCRTETFIVKSTLELIEGTPPTVEEHELCRTVHGPVIAIDSDAGIAYSQRYAMWGAEAGSLKGLMRFAQADSLEEFTDAMAMVTWNENTTYADIDGNIAFWHPGLYPKRPRDFDERLPYPGTGEAEWEGLLDFEQMPHTINPAQDWVANWNSKPSVGWTSGDPHYGDRPWGQANRLDAIAEVLGSDYPIDALPGPGPDGLLLGRAGVFAPDVNAGVHELTIDYFRGFLEEAAADPAASERQRAALQLMLNWDGNLEDTDGDGKYDTPGAALFDAWVEPAAKSVFNPYLKIGGFSRGGHRFEPSPVINMFLRALLGDAATLPQSRDYLQGKSNAEVILATLDDALARLETSFSTADMSQWLRDIATEELELQGVGPEGEIPFQDRGSWIQVIEYPAG